MFVTQPKSPNKVKFLKPNILRKRSVKTNNVISTTLPSVTTVNKVDPVQDLAAVNITKHKCSKPNHLIRRPQLRQQIEPSTDVDKKSTNIEDTPLNISMFKNNVITAQDVILQININDFPISPSNNTNPHTEKWCYVTINNKTDIDKDDTHKQENKVFRVPQTTPRDIELKKNEALLIKEAEKYAANNTLNNNITQLFPITTVKLKCDFPGCNKEFSSDRTLKIHKSVHNKPRVWKQATVIKCPASKPGSDRKEPCGEVFNERKDVLLHLSTEHTLDDACHSCESCLRRFFWGAGVRAHSRACEARGGARRPELRCDWPGCQRVFHQPCRLKEHRRAHTGDRPYPCRYPNCSASFRTSSKLVRHGRRHTGDRRYRCPTCGRAFLRGEHLRAHAARHDAHRTQRTRRRTNTEKKIMNEADVVVEPSNVTSVELQEEAVELTPVQGDTDQDWTIEQVDDPFMVVCESCVSWPPEGEGHSARTHCTWPLSRPGRAAPPGTSQGHSDAIFLTEDLVQVELSEVQESNVYTISSDLCLRTYNDLFLHGNVAQETEVSGEEGGAVLLQDTLLSDEMELLDAHPTIDLMPEELLYTDVAVDETSFQVLPLSADDLTHV